jgi:hypothetical protein
VDEDWRNLESKSSCNPDDEEEEVKQVARKEISKDNAAAWGEYKVFTRGLSYGKQADKERAVAMEALYSACIRKNWPVVLRLDGVRLREKWVKSRDRKGEGGAFWKERRTMDVRRREMEQRQRSEKEAMAQRDRGKAGESEESDVDEDEPDVRKEREKEKEEKEKVHAKTQAKDARKKWKILNGKRKQGKYLLVE